jgi:16S rRNA processing protein RimM
MTSKIRPEHLVLVARIGPAHGVHGAFRLFSFTEKPLAVLDYGPYLDKFGAVVLDQFKLIEAQKLIVSAAPWPSREDVLKAKGFEFYVPRLRFSDLEDHDNFYIIDLIGLKIKNRDGDTIGQIKGIDNFGAGDLLLISLNERSDLYLPFTYDHVPEVHIQQGYIVADLTGFITDEPS